MPIDVLRLGLARGWIELRLSLPLVLNYVFFPSLALAVMYFLRGVDVAGGSLGHYAIPGILAMNVVLTGFMGLATVLISEREDGTLLRARSVPYGIHTFLIGKVSSQVALTFVTVTVMMVEAVVLFGDFVQTDAARTMSLLWVLPLGLTATLPWGAVLGSVVRHPRNLSFVSLAVMGLVTVSGVFYPLAQQPLVAQVLGQSTPVYWMALAIRSTLLGDAAAAAEIGGSWRPVETVAVLGLWSVVGVAVAVHVLRRNARRDSGTRRRTDGRPAQAAGSVETSPAS